MPLSACDYPFYRSRLSARLLCPGGARPATTEATAENSSHQRPTGTRSPFGGSRRLQSSLFPLCGAREGKGLVLFGSSLNFNLSSC